MISKKTKYGLKALIHLAGLEYSQPVLISDLACAANLPKKFLEFILLTLRKGGILQSRVGKGGGYYMTLAPSKISIGAVVRILEGDLAPIQCLSETNYARCDECLDETTCGIRLAMVDVNRAISQAFDNLTLADMIERSKLASQSQSKIMDYRI